MNSTGGESNKSVQSKFSISSIRKVSVDDDSSRSCDRSSNATRAGSKDRVLKLKINKTKGKNLSNGSGGGS